MSCDVCSRLNKAGGKPLDPNIWTSMGPAQTSRALRGGGGGGGEQEGEEEQEDKGR